MKYNEFAEYEHASKEYKSYHLDCYIDPANPNKTVLSNSIYDTNVSTLRPSICSYDEIIESKSYTLNSALLIFDKGESLSEMIMACATQGYPIDFIHLRVYQPKDSRKDNSTWGYNTDSFVTKKIIDTHKDDLSEMINLAEAPQYYIAKAKSTLSRSRINWMVIDRFKQSFDVDFIHGKYDNDGVIAGFRERKVADKFLASLI